MEKRYTISIIGSQSSPGSEEEKFELITDGEFSRTDGEARISYADSSVTGFLETGAAPASLTTFVVEPSRVTLTRGSWFGGDMVFEEARKHHFLYQTPFGSLTMGIDTESIVRDIGDNGGRVQIKYALEVDNVTVSRNSFHISVNPS